jgi:hypothetical protein
MYERNTEYVILSCAWRRLHILVQIFKNFWRKFIHKNVRPLSQNFRKSGYIGVKGKSLAYFSVIYLNFLGESDDGSRKISLQILSLCSKSVNRHFLYISRDANRKTTVLVFRHWIPAIFSLATLSVVISLRYRIFLPACPPPRLWGGLCSAIVHRPVRLFFEIFLSAWGSKHVSASVRASEVLLVLPEIRCFVCVCVWLINFWQNCATDLLSLLWPWSLSVFACVHR